MCVRMRSCVCAVIKGDFVQMARVKCESSTMVYCGYMQTLHSLYFIAVCTDDRHDLCRRQGLSNVPQSNLLATQRLRYVIARG